MKPFFYLSLLLAATTAQAQTIESALKACTQQENSLKRLVCYDNLVKNLNQYHGLNKQMAQTTVIPRQATNTSAVVAAPVLPAPNNDFGLEKKRLAEAQQDKITSQVAKVVKKNRGNLTITLQNGQVWRQIDGGTLRIKEGSTVFVERAALGSFRMGKPNANKRIRVKRVK